METQKRRMRRAAGLMAALLLTGAALAAAAEEPGASGAGYGPAAEAVITEDEEQGVWTYSSPDLEITVTRYTEKIKPKKKAYDLIYCVADIHASPASPLTAILTEPTKKKAAGENLVSPDLLVEKHRPIFAMSDDLYGIRLQKYDYHGVVIRNGEIYATKTRNSAKKRAWPNLDTLAVFADGSMKTFICDAHTAEEYLAMGAEQVFSFGPWLISEGKTNPQVYDPKYYHYSYARAAIGMVEPYHYIGVAVQGTKESQTGKMPWIGVTLDWMADKMAELGCTEALNLDGGGTATMFFNGKVILAGYLKKDKATKQYVPEFRSQGSLIGFGLPEPGTEE